MLLGFYKTRSYEFVKEKALHFLFVFCFCSLIFFLFPRFTLNTYPLPGVLLFVLDFSLCKILLAEPPLLLLGGSDDDVIYLKDHFHDLGSEAQLASFAVEGLVDALLLHVGGAFVHAVHAAVGTLLLQVAGLCFG